MTSRISALMDSELGRKDAEEAIDALRIESEARESWRVYHLIGDAMRDTHLVSDGFAGRVAARLAAEPTVLAPRPRPLLEQRRWQLLSAAASLAAIALVASVAFGPQEDSLPPPIARSASAPTPPVETAQVPPPEAADEYVLAHQGYSPRNSLQGMATYVRTVSSEMRGSRP